LLAHALKMRRLDLYLNFARTLTEAELEEVRILIKRRARREPLQHILGTASFCGWDLVVNSDVLVPRPETESLAQRAWEFLGGLSASAPQPARALDLGTGSGCLAIALAIKCPNAQIDAVDISPEALRVACENAARHAVAGQIRFFQSDAFTAVPTGPLYDLVVSNPPYVPSGEIDSLQPEVRCFDPRLALDGGVDGLDFFRRLADDAPAFLRPGGRIMLEFGDRQGAPLMNLFAQRQWAGCIELDASGRDRIFIAGRVSDSAS
jgi:release factor glutamine methyltransferase